MKARAGENQVSPSLVPYGLIHLPNFDTILQANDTPWLPTRTRNEAERASLRHTMEHAAVQPAGKS